MVSARKRVIEAENLGRLNGTEYHRLTLSCGHQALLYDSYMYRPPPKTWVCRKCEKHKEGGDDE